MNVKFFFYVLYVKHIKNYKFRICVKSNRIRLRYFMRFTCNLLFIIHQYQKKIYNNDRQIDLK